MHFEKIKAKIALRVVQNGLITLKDCRVPEADRLQNANSFKDTAKVLRMTRTGVAWFAVGCQMASVAREEQFVNVLKAVLSEVARRSNSPRG